MKKLLSLLLICTFLLPTVVFAEEPFPELSETFDIKEKYLSYDYSIRYFDQDNYILDNFADDNYNVGMFDYSNNVIIPPEYKELDLFYEDLAVAQKFIYSKYGYLDKNGNWAIVPKFDMADRFSNGLAYVYKNGQSAYIDKTGKPVYILNEDESGSRFSNGRAIIYAPEETRIINTNFETISSFPNTFSWVSPWQEDRFIVQEYNEENGDNISKLVDTEQNIYYTVVNGTIDEFIDGKALVTQGSKVQLINNLGEVVGEKDLLSEYSYFVRVCENVNIEDAYEENDVNIIRIYNDNFELIGEYENFYVRVNIDEKSMLFVPQAEDDLHYFFLNKNVNPKEPIITKYENYEEFENKTNNSVIVLKIGSAKVYVYEEINFLEWETSATNYTAPFIRNSRTMVPIRFISENFGENNFNVDYFETDGRQEVIISGDKEIKLVIGETTTEVTTFNKETKQYETYTEILDVAPVISNDRTFVPVRFISETMGLNVEWDERGYVIIGNENLVPKNLDELFSAPLDIKNYPRIDGSTATIPLSVALSSKMLNISENAAYNITEHTKTENAFKNLLNDQADLLITGTPNESKIQKAQDVGMELEYYPFAKDSFVFFVNKDNPVDTLTSEQIRKIYSGEITNWKDVGGNDAEIIAYQRNEDSGSQNLMKKFMGDTPLMQPKVDTINSMGEIIDIIAEYDNDVNAIGYSVGYYMSEMHFSEDVKVIKLDGIEASAENIRSSIYPQILEYALVFDSNEAENSPIRKMVEFLKSEDGIELIEDTNFIAIKQ